MAIGDSDEDILRDNTITEHVPEALWTVVATTLPKAQLRMRSKSSCFLSTLISPLSSSLALYPFREPTHLS
jgi:hypothetical protein